MDQQETTVDVPAPPDAFAASGHRIRAIDPTSAAEVAQVASRMQATLVEVLGEERGRAMYTMDWLTQRVLWHLDPQEVTAQVFLAERADGHITGHTIVRLDRNGAGEPIGLFSTTYVEPASRKQAIADSLLRHGEAWMREQGMTEAATYTSETNTKLINLYTKHGYGLVAAENAMVILAKPLAAEP
jgi:GNAT superfamily N-acetyltransferase